MRASLRFDQLRADAHPPTALSDRAFQNVAHAQLATDLLYVDRLALVGEGAVASDHEKPSDAAECRNYLLDHAVGEILLLGVAGQVLERQHRNRRFVWQRQHRVGDPHPRATRASLPRLWGRVRE